ncbi:beta strand repeat-containing protein [Bradyrhizobium tunisiense]|uniref:beta strand repeat-containing protein n=1 Tax=Bradyrhizobium tunisiense TaxID=3278709 RepID=UPI0035DC0C13
MKLRGIIALALALACQPAYAQTNPGSSPLSVVKGGTGKTAIVVSRTAAADLDLSAFDVVKTLGYAKAGDGGGATFYKRNTAILTYSITNAGSCNNGVWPGIRLTGGTGSGAYGTLTVAGGVATNFTIQGSGAQGNGYTVSDILTVSNAGNVVCATYPTITVNTVGNGPFIDSAVTGVTINTAGASCTNGTFYGLTPQNTVTNGGGFGDRLQGNVTISGGALTAFTINVPGGGYKVGDLLNFVNPNATTQLAGCVTQPVLQVSSTASPRGSFTDDGSNAWQIMATDNSLNVLQFGAIADYNWLFPDGDGTDNGPAFRAVAAFAAAGNGPADAHGYGGGFIYVPRGGYLICGGVTQYEYVSLQGAGFGATNLKQCNTDGATSSLITQGDPLSRVGNYEAKTWDMTLYGSTSGTGPVIYSNNNQSGDALARLAIYPNTANRTCVKYEIGYGGQSQYGIHSVSCVPQSGSPAFDLSGNFGFKIDGQSMVSSILTVAVGIRVGDGGFASIDGFHCEGSVTACVSVNGTGSSPPKVHVIDGVGPATRFVVNESGSPIGNITLQNFVSNGSGCALYNATTATCVVTGDIPQTYPASGGMTQLTGDVTAGPGTGSQAATLATVNANVGSFGSATNCVAFTTNGKGLITAASQTTCTPALASITGLGTGVATALAVNVGTSGAVVVNGGALGTPSSGTLTNATGLPISTGVSGLGAGCATWLGTPSSANLRGCVTDETGTGAAVFGTSPTISTPDIVGVADTSNANAGSVGEYISVHAPNSDNTATITVTIASPAVVTWTSNPFLGGGTGTWTVPVVFTTTGALPTGLTAGTTYWVIGSTVTTNTFQIATSAANAIAGTAINTSGSQSGTHTGTSGASLTSGANANVAAISVTAGDWDVSGAGVFLPAASTSITSYGTSWSTSSGSFGGLGQFVQFTTPATVWGHTQGMVPLPSFRLKLSGTTTMYLVSFSTHTVSTNTGSGFLAFRRQR